MSEEAEEDNPDAAPRRWGVARVADVPGGASSLGHMSPERAWWALGSGGRTKPPGVDLRAPERTVQPGPLDLLRVGVLGG